MQRYFIKNNQVNENKITIENQDLHHIKNVMRFKVGDSIVCLDELGNKYLASIKEFNKNNVILNITNKVLTTNNTMNLTLAQALIKKDKFELVLQKATELGVKEIIPINTKNSIIKIDNQEKKLSRFETIVKEASEQSERNTLPVISDIIDIKDLPFEQYDYVLTAYARNEEKSLKDIISNISSNKSVLVLIGPEGGFTKTEIDFLKEKSVLVSLGNTILRSETAAIYLISAIRLIWEN